MEEIISLSKYIEKIEEIISTKSDDEILFFRGHAQTDYKLKPSIGRIDGYNKHLEKQLFFEFKRRYHLYTQENPKNDMDVLFLAQHYGLPTRLLDWTYNPLIALYFACETDKDDGCVFYVKMPNDLRSHKQNYNGQKMPETIDEIIEHKQNVFITPESVDIRIQNQQGLFLLCNPEEDIRGESIIIAKSEKKKILKSLALCGFDEQFIYPSLDSLSRSIKAKYLSK
ncbi:FRG domain-containing protein [Phocaeicola salanitronis]|uniref:FRG domain-containing protein n=1 Tax=Phocaeicola salanitronis TaxID=376805 RepID=UPI0023F9B4F5|nr:FRG domain-containing protein [Phocaeicola salanitronis]